MRGGAVSVWNVDRPISGDDSASNPSLVSTISQPISRLQKSIKGLGERAVSIQDAGRSTNGDDDAFSPPSVSAISETIRAFRKSI